jgi:hypothetical protein
MTANHVEHEIATFPGSPGRGGQQRPRRSAILPTQGLAAGSVSADRQRVNESPGGEAGASRRKYVQRGSRRPNIIPKRETRYHPKA